MRRSMATSVSILLAAFLSQSASTETASAETLSGVVRYVGRELPPRMVSLSADPECAKLHPSERVADRAVTLGEDGALADVFVWLETAPEGTGPFETPQEPKRLEQIGCFYLPRVTGIMVEQTLEVVNDDPTLHNVRSLARANRPINLGQPIGSPPRTKFFTKPEEAIKFKCDVHPWMAAYLFVLEHPFYATTGADGRFSIPDLPAGTYQVSFWHEMLGRQVVEAVVGSEGEALQVSFDSPPSK